MIRNREPWYGDWVSFLLLAAVLRVVQVNSVLRIFAKHLRNCTIAQLHKCTIAHFHFSTFGHLPTLLESAEKKVLKFEGKKENTIGLHLHIFPSAPLHICTVCASFPYLQSLLKCSRAVAQLVAVQRLHCTKSKKSISIQPRTGFDKFVV